MNENKNQLVEEKLAEILKSLGYENASTEQTAEFATDFMTVVQSRAFLRLEEYLKTEENLAKMDALQTQYGDMAPEVVQFLSSIGYDYFDVFLLEMDIYAGELRESNDEMLAHFTE